MVDIDRKWNESCINDNTRTFISVFGYEPNHYEEVKSWIQRILDDDQEKNGKESLEDIAPWL